MSKTKAVDKSQLHDVVQDIVARMGIIEQFGKTADHIEGLEELETDRFGIAVVTADGDTVIAGDADVPFPIQSISKVFALTLALKAFGDDVWKRVGREPSGDPFNSIIDLERHKGIPRNPFINAGALVVCDMLLDIAKEHGVAPTVRDFLIGETGTKKLGVVEEIIEEDGQKAGFLNRSLANMSKAHDNLNHKVDEVMKLYVEQCAVELDCRQLALAGRYLMRDTLEDKSGNIRERAWLARRVNALMITCGQYDGSGDFAYRVGLPAKSGVAGAILAVAPEKASIAVWSPALDENGNSMLGTMALELLAEKMSWSVFG